MVAMAAAFFAPALRLAGVVSPLSFLHAPWIQFTGIALAVIGIAATAYAQVDMGDSWRIGVDPTETTILVRKGVFGLVRNPIFTAMFVFGFGIALVTPNVVAIVGFVLLVLTIEFRCVSSKSRICRRRTVRATGSTPLTSGASPPAWD